MPGRLLVEQLLYEVLMHPMLTFYLGLFGVIAVICLIARYGWIVIIGTPMSFIGFVSWILYGAMLHHGIRTNYAEYDILVLSSLWIGFCCTVAAVCWLSYVKKTSE